MTMTPANRPRNPQTNETSDGDATQRDSIAFGDSTPPWPRVRPTTSSFQVQVEVAFRAVDQSNATQDTAIQGQDEKHTHPGTETTNIENTCSSISATAHVLCETHVHGL